MGIALAWALACAGCTAPPAQLADAGSLAGDARVDAPTNDALGRSAGPGLAVDQLALTGEGALFALLGSALINDFAAQRIAAGQLLLALQVDVGVDGDANVGVFFASDSDDDPTDNFDVEQPERLIVSTSAFDATGAPVVALVGSVDGDELTATGSLDLALPGALAFAADDAVLSGTLVSGGDGFDSLRDASVRATMPALAIASVPNLLIDMCPGDDLLDLMVNGCGFLPPAQPTVDVDGDGLERFVTGANGVIDLCIDGDGVTELRGVGCVNDPTMADGYTFELSMHATRVELVLGE